MLSKNDLDRIKKVQGGKWLPHPHAQFILAELELVMNQPAIDGAPMGKSIIGKSGSGKTTVLKQFVEQNTLDNGSVEGQPIYLNAPSGPDLNVLLMSILQAVNDFKASSKTAREKEKRIIRILSHLKPSVVIIDEAQNLVEGTSKQTRKCLNAIKSISNEVSIPTILAATEDLIPAIVKDDQYRRRWRPVRLDTYHANNQAFVELVNAMLVDVPLERLEIPLPKTAYKKIHDYSGGVIGLVKELLVNATRQAINDQSERIKSEHIRPL